MSFNSCFVKATLRRNSSLLGRSSLSSNVSTTEATIEHYTGTYPNIPYFGSCLES